MARVIDEVRTLIEPKLEELDYDLFDMEYTKEGKNWYLRIYIDKLGGVTIEDCVTVSEVLSEILDQADPDPIPGAYYLEVSSPGAERPLKNEADIQASIGKWVHLKLYQAFEGAKEWEGRLLQADEEAFTIEVKDKTRRIEKTIPRQLVALIRLAIEF